MMRFLLLALAVFSSFWLAAQPTPRPGREPVIKQTPASQPRNAGSVTPASNTRNAQQRSENSAQYQTGRQQPTSKQRAGSQVKAPSDRVDTRPSTTLSPNTPANYPPRPAMKNYPSNAGKQAREVEVIRWYTLQEALELSKTNGKRKIFIDVYTQWCGWCKRLDETTFVDPAVARYINKNYYPVKFDAEQTGDIVFREKTYKFKRSGNRGHHELAAEWLNNRLSYPTMVFLDENMNTIQSIPGYQEARKLEAILNFFGTDSHKTTPWETYERKFISQ